MACCSSGLLFSEASGTPIGVLSLDADNVGNTASTVDAIEMSAAKSDAAN